MPRGGKVNKKGRARHFTSPEEIERQNREDNKAWRAKKEEESEEEEEDEASKSEGSDSESSDSGEAPKKDSGATAEVANPNRVVQKTKKVEELSAEKPELSRREREEIEKQRAKEHYQRMHAQGKTEEARADLARLAIIRQQREEAARKREEEKKMKEAEKAAKTASIHRAIGKRT